jgi:hypothetical protein
MKKRTALLLVTATLMKTSIVGEAQSSSPRVNLEQGYRLVFRGQCEDVELRFGVRSDEVVDSVLLFYRTGDKGSYSKTRLSRQQDLRYVGRTPCETRLNFYLEVHFERGPKQLVGSALLPSTIETSAFEARELKPSFIRVHTNLVTVIASVVMVLGAGVAAVSHH